MKYTIAVAALLGKTNALPAFTTLAEYADGSKADGINNIACQTAMRAQKTAAWSYWSKYVYQNAKTGKTLDSKKATEIVCKGNTATAGQCKDGTKGAWAADGSVKTGFAYIKGFVAATNSRAGNRINGVHACPQ